MYREDDECRKKPAAVISSSIVVGRNGYKMSGVVRKISSGNV